jgi:hypothetical protein
LRIPWVCAKRIKPEQCDPFFSYPGVQALMKQLRIHVCGALMAVLMLSDGALHDVFHDAGANAPPSIDRSQPS